MTVSGITLVLLALAALAHGAAVWGGLGVAGGQDAQPHEFPHHVSMQVSTLWLFERHICGATIISPEWVLTAAHCARSVPWYSSTFILAGKHSLSAKSEEGQQRAAVSAMYVHEKYTRGESAHDIALLHLKTPLVFSDAVQAAVLPAAGSNPAGLLTVTGWGQVSEKKDGDVLQKVELPVIPFDKCSGFLQKAGATSQQVDTEFCVGNLMATKGQSTCKGDDGSPVSQWNVGRNAWTVVGVSTFSIMPCGAQPSPSVYTRVSAYLDWIKTTMSKV